MFGRKKVVEVEPELIAPKRGTVELADEFTSEYEAAAGALGLNNGAMSEARVRRVLSAMGLAPFDYDEVSHYLDRVFGKGESWHWFPLRQADADANLTLRSQWRTWSNRGIAQGRLYHLAVPLPVLHTVQRILEAAPEVHFYCSGKWEPEVGDPFLMVCAIGMDPLVIEQWDEPNFTGKRK